jgi:hypothetical protein
LGRKMSHQCPIRRSGFRLRVARIMPVPYRIQSSGRTAVAL